MELLKSFKNIFEVLIVIHMITCGNVFSTSGNLFMLQIL